MKALLLIVHKNFILLRLDGCNEKTSCATSNLSRRFYNKAMCSKRKSEIFKKMLGDNFHLLHRHPIRGRQISLVPKLSHTLSTTYIGWGLQSSGISKEMPTHITSLRDVATQLSTPSIGEYYKNQFGILRDVLRLHLIDLQGLDFCQVWSR